MPVTFITDPIRYEKDLSSLGKSLTIPIQVDRVFELTYSSIPDELLQKIQYKPCSVIVENVNPLNIAGMLPIVHEELQYILQMDISDYFPSYNDGLVTWTNQITGDPLYLSPSIPQGWKWDVKAIEKYFPIGTDPWIPWLIDSQSTKILLTQWKDVWLVESEELQINLLLEKESLKQNYIMNFPSKQWKMIKGTWPIKILADNSSSDVLLQGTNSFNKDWIYLNSIKSVIPVPVTFWPIPEPDLPIPIQLFKLYHATHLTTHKLLPIYDRSLQLVKLYTTSEESLDEFYDAYYMLPIKDMYHYLSPPLHQQEDIISQKRGYRVIDPNTQEVYLITYEPISVGAPEKTSFSKYKDINSQWNNHTSFLNWMGFK